MTDDLFRPPDISQLTPAQARTVLERMAADFHGLPVDRSLDALKERHANELAAQKTTPPPDSANVFKFSPEQAAAKLAEIGKQNLKALADPIGAAIDGTLPIDGITTTGIDGGLAPRKMIATVEQLREFGLNDEAIRQALDGRPVSKEEFDNVKTLQRELHGDKEWVQKLLSGDAKARTEQTLMSLVLSSGIKTA